MTDSVRIYFEFDREIQQVMLENNISIDDMLREAGIDTRSGHDRIPVPEDEGQRSRDLVPVLELAVASSAVIGTLGFVINRVLNTVFNRPRYVEYDELVELRDAEGNVMLDAKAKPLYKKVPHRKILQPQHQEKESFDADLKKFVMRFTSEENRGK